MSSLFSATVYGENYFDSFSRNPLVIFKKLINYPAASYGVFLSKQSHLILMKPHIFLLRALVFYILGYCILTSIFSNG